MTRVPAAYASRNITNTRIKTSRNGSCLLYSRELFNVVASKDNVIDFALPICPTKWENTRTKTFAQAYCDSRLLKFVYTFMPAQGTSAAGRIAFGTSFSDANSNYTNKEQMINQLPATNGGFQSTMWLPTTRRVGLGSNLSRNLYSHYNVEPDDIPFWLYGVNVGASEGTVLGTIKIQAIWSMKNPTYSNNYQNLDGSFTADSSSGVIKVAKSLLNGAYEVGRQVYMKVKNLGLNSKVNPMTITATVSANDGVNVSFNLPAVLSSITGLAMIIIGAANWFPTAVAATYSEDQSHLTTIGNIDDDADPIVAECEEDECDDSL